MELTSFRATLPSRSTLVKLYPLGDIHLGAPACDVAAFRRTVAAIANDPFAFWIGMGDYHDCLLPNDPRWHLRAIDWNTVERDARGQWDVSDLAEWSVELVEKELRPILTPEKCLGLIEGNHEQVMARHYFTDLTRRLAKKHAVPFLGQTAIVRWTFERPSGSGKYVAVMHDIFAEHGATGGGTDGNSINNLNRRLEQWDASIFLKGHVHKRAVYRKTRYAWGNGKVRHRKHVMALTGTYLKGYDEGQVTYSERKGYAPNEIGGTVILIKPLAETPMLEAVYTDALEILQAA